MLLKYIECAWAFTHLIACLETNVNRFHPSEQDSDNSILDMRRFTQFQPVGGCDIYVSSWEQLYTGLITYFCKGKEESMCDPFSIKWQDNTLRIKIRRSQYYQVFH